MTSVVSQREIKTEVKPARQLGAVVNGCRLLSVGDGEDRRAICGVLEADQFVEATLSCLLHALEDRSLAGHEEGSGIDGGCDGYSLYEVAS